jgi:spore coat polysaccharide biosynthesis protein SpsF
VYTFLSEPWSQNQIYSSKIPDTNSRISHPFDFVANRLPPPWIRTLPIGLDVEVCSFAALERAWVEADQVYQREHVMPFLYDGISFPPKDFSSVQEWYIEHNTSRRGFNVALLNHHPDYGSLRWTVDTPADLEFVRQVYRHLEGQAGFGWLDVLALLQQVPGLAGINADVKHKSAFDVDQRTSRQ